ncbi:glycosyltransferase [Agromyces mariniharenae]|nr:glycosyltransferase [Agromyces mariniharenae]
MFPRVTAVLVVRHGGDHLERTLDAIRFQDRAPDALVAVLAQADARAREQVAGAAPDRIVELQEPLSFGEALRAGERVLEAPASDADALWLLAEDSEPRPGALRSLMATLETARSVAVAGPKLLEWDEPDRIAGLGRTMTRLGRAVPIVADELDQGQHDGLSDVLGLDPAAILVRHSVWQALDGFDPALPTVDDGLDLGVRARLAGHRVAVVPEAEVLFAADGVAGPPGDGRSRSRRRRARAARAAALHRRLAYAPAPAVPLHWITFLPLAVLRSVRLLLIKRPGEIPGEFAAALGTMFSGMRVPRARRVLASSKQAKWSAIAPLRLQPDEQRRRREAAAEARKARARGRSNELQFLGTGGGWVLLATAAASVGLFSWLITASGVGGGGLLPLSGFAELWRNAAYGWRDVGTGFVGAADPFSGVLAVLGSLTFWAPSYAVLLLWLVAIPAAAIGAWFAASRLTERGSLRAVAALVYAFAPPFLTALAEARPGAVIAHVLLGWLAFAVFGAASSWAAAATASLLFAAVIAAAPSLAPALIVGWIVAVAVSGRAAVRLAGLPVPALVLALPLIVEQVGRGTPFGLLADPGVPVGGPVPTPWQLAVGLPSGGWGGWDELVGSFVEVDPKLVASILAVPLVLAALAAVLAPGWRRATLTLGTVLLGYATAVAATHVAVAVVGPDVVAVWAGAGLSLAWLGLVLASVSALDALRRGPALLGAVVAVVSLVAVVPTMIAIAADAVPLGPAGERTLPAYVVAQADTDPRVTTLWMEPEVDGGLRATLEHGTGETLDDQSTLDQTRTVLTDEQVQLATVAGNLASRSGFDPEAAVRDFGVSFVLLAPASDEGREAVQTEARARAALDGNPALIAVGETDFGALWRFAAAEPDAEAAQIPPDAGGWLAVLITIVQVVVIGAAVLLSIPTGAGREVDRRPTRVRRRAAAAAAARAAAAGGGAAAAAEAEDADAAAADDEEAEEPDAAASDESADEPDAAAADDGTMDDTGAADEEPHAAASDDETAEDGSAEDAGAADEESGDDAAEAQRDRTADESKGDDDGRAS